MRRFMFIASMGSSSLLTSIESEDTIRKRCERDGVDIPRLMEFIELAKPGDYFRDGDILIVELRTS